MDQRLPQHFDLNLKECFHLNNPDPHITHRCGAWLACGCMCLWNTSDTQTETLNDLIARNSGNLWVNDPSCVSIYCDWSKLWSLRNVRLKKGRREGGKGYESRWGEEKIILLQPFAHFHSPLSGTEIHSQQLTERDAWKTRKQGPVIREETLDRKWFPAVGLRDSNTWFILQQPSFHWPFTYSNSSFPQFKSGYTFEEILVFGRARSESTGVFQKTYICTRTFLICFFKGHFLKLFSWIVVLN